MNEMWYFIAVIVLASATYVLIDARQREMSVAQALFWAVFLFFPFLLVQPLFALLWSFAMIPAYITLRPLKAWETRVGGRAWQLGRNISISLIILIVFGLTLFFTAREMARNLRVPPSDVAPVLGVEGLTRIITLPILAVFIAFGVGRYFRDPSVIEHGAISRLPDEAPASPTSVSSAVEYRDGGYWVAGSRVSLDSIVATHAEGLAPEAIVAECFPILTVEQVKGAIDYYLTHRQDIDAYLSKTQAEFDAQSQREKEHPSPLRIKLDEALRQRSARL